MEEPKKINLYCCPVCAISVLRENPKFPKWLKCYICRYEVKKSDVRADEYYVHRGQLKNPN